MIEIKKGITFPKSFTTVTKTSKIIALIMFIAFPLIGFYLGWKYGNATILNEKDAVDKEASSTVSSQVMEYREKVGALLNNSYVTLSSSNEVYDFNTLNVYIPSLEGKTVTKIAYWSEGRILTSYQYEDENSGINYSIWKNSPDGENDFSNQIEDFVYLDGPEFIGPVYVQDELIKDSLPVLETEWFDFYSGIKSSPWSITGARLYSIENAGVGTEYTFIQLSKSFENEFVYRGTEYNESDLNSAKKEVIDELTPEAEEISRRIPAN